MKSNVSMLDIAERFNVSKVTVSKALNGREGVSDELRSQIKEAAEQMGYRINSAARSLKTKKSYNIGLLISERYINVENSYYFGICGKLVTQLAENDYSAIIETLREDYENNLSYPMMYVEGKIDGLIIIGQLKTNYLKMFENFDIPVIFFDFYLDEIKVDSIVVDNFYSGFSITNLLINQGHTQIGFVGNVYATSSIQDRFLGFYRALLEHKITINYDYFINDRDDDGHLVRLELPKQMPTALVCNNDEVAYRVIKLLNEKGYKVPEDCSVVCFDNTIYSTIAKPILTTVDTNVAEMVRVVCKMILKKISHPEKHYDCIQIKSSIVVRDSVKAISAKGGE